MADTDTETLPNGTATLSEEDERMKQRPADIDALVGAPCGQHGQYTFYKALRLVGKREKILAIGDFFFVRIWQDSELVSIGELQLLWTDRVSDQTLVSLRLYFLPENTPFGRNQHGEDEVLVLNEKVVLRAEDLLSWICEGSGWRCGLRAVWRGACVPPETTAPLTSPLQHTKMDFSDVDKEKNAIAWSGPSDAEPESTVTAPLHQINLDFSDVDKEKDAIEEEPDTPGVVVFSYPRYCRYRALLARLEGMQSTWLRDSLVAALGGYAASTNNTTILYCKDTFEYPELEGHEFVCNHLAPRLKGRPRGRRRRLPRSRSHTPSSRSSDSEVQERTEVKEHKPTATPRRLSLRNGASDKASEEEEDIKQSPEDQQFLDQLGQFYKERGDDLAITHAVKDLSLRALYERVSTKGGYEAVCRNRLWRSVHQERPARVRSLYERFLLPYENQERRNGRLRANGRLDELHTIHVLDSPLRENSPLETIDNKIKEDVKAESRTAEELNREFLESLPKEDKPMISVKPPQLLIDPDKQKQSTAESTFLEALKSQEISSSALSSLSSLVNGHSTNGAGSDQKSGRPAGKSSLRAVRVKPTRPAHSAGNTPPIPSLRPDSASSSPPSFIQSSSLPAPGATSFGVARTQQHHSDDEIVEVPYKPKTPEIIDLDEYPESPQSSKKKKLDILKERGLEVTPIPPAWGSAPTLPPGVPLAPIVNPPLLLNPAMQHQIMTQASLFQMYNIIPQNYANGIQPPKVIQSSCIYGTSGPEKTVYGNPKDPFMPPPHVLQGTPIKPQKTFTTEKVESAAPTRQGILDLTCKSVTPSQKPTVEIVRVPSIPSPSKTPQNMSKNYTLMDGKAVVGSNLEITLVSPKSQTPPKNRQPQKRSSNGKFMSTKTPTPPKDFPKEYPKPYPSPSGAKLSPTVKKNPISIPTYQITKDDISPTSSTGSRESQHSNMQNVYKNQNLAQIMDLQKGQLPSLPQNMGALGQLPQLMDLQKSVPMSPFMDPMYMSALYSSLAGQMDSRQLAMYRDLMANQFRYSGLLGGVATPTTKN